MIQRQRHGDGHDERSDHAGVGAGGDGEGPLAEGGDRWKIVSVRGGRGPVENDFRARREGTGEIEGPWRVRVLADRSG